MREESKQFLLPDISANENFEFGDEKVALTKIWQKLSRNNQFRKKRELKAALKLQDENPSHSSVKSFSTSHIID